MNKDVKILLIEDDPDDIDLLRTHLEDNNVRFSMEVLIDGEKIFSFMRESNYEPDVIVMDFNLPKLHGKDVLKEIKSADRLRHVPLVVLTTSHAKEDIDYAYKLGANGFITKPTTIEGFNSTVSTIVSLANDAEAV